MHLSFSNLPRAIMLGIPLVTVCYLLTNLSYLTIMSKETLLASNAVAAVSLFNQYSKSLKDILWFFSLWILTFMISYEVYFRGIYI